MKSQIGNHKSQIGFTLVELMVVVTIIAILLALLTPALDRAMEQAERAVCGGRQHQIINIFNAYAVENKRRYLGGYRDQDNVEHTPWVSNAFVRYIVSVAGNTNPDGQVPPLLIDPAYSDWPAKYQDSLGSYVIGYNYLGGHPFVDKANDGTQETPNWDSPITLAKPGDGDLIACHAFWRLGSPSLRSMSMAHSEQGPQSTEGVGSEDPLTLGLTGMNKGYTDGSVAWKDASKTVQYWSCADADTYYNWPARW